MALVRETIKVPEQTRIELKSLCEIGVSLVSGYPALTDLDLWLTSWTVSNSEDVWGHPPLQNQCSLLCWKEVLKVPCLLQLTVSRAF